MAREAVKVDQLARFKVFAGMQPQTRQRLAEGAQMQSWDAGQLMFQRGDQGDRLYALLSGQVRLSVMTPQGKELVLGLVSRLNVLGEFSLLDGEPRSTDALAVKPTSALVITREHFLQLAHAHPDLPLAFARYLCGLVRATNFQLESIALYDLQNRLIRFFLRAGQSQQGAEPPGRVRLEAAPSQSDLAAALGATRSRVNNALQALIAEGALIKEGAALVLDLTRLTDLAQQAEAGLA